MPHLKTSGDHPITAKAISQSAAIIAMREEISIDFHKVSPIELCERFNTNIKTGLSDDDATKGLEKYGPNLITPPPTTPIWVKFLQSLFSHWLPWMGSALCFIAYIVGFGVANYYLGLVICGLTIVDHVYSFYQRMKLENVVDQMSQNDYVSQSVQVIRNGKMTRELASNLTIGDIVEIKKGDVVPADLRILESNGCKVDQSSLTGESEPQLKTPKFTHENPIETENIAFMNTTVEEGSALAMVALIGDNTVSARISGLASVLSRGQSLIDRKIENYVSTITTFIFFVGIILFIIANLFGHNWLFAIIFLVGLIPTVVHAKVNATVNDTFVQLLYNNCMLKNTESLEVLANVSTICLNKTGIITQFKRMTVAHLWQNNKIEEVNFNKGNESPSQNPLLRAALLCNNAVFKPDQEGVHWQHREFYGNGTDGAILQNTLLNVDNPIEYRANNKKVYEVPFNSYYRYQITIHETEEKQHLVVMKGAPERIIERCNTIFIDGKDEPLNQERKAAFQNALNEMAGFGERVIGFCDLMLPADKYPIGHTFEPEEEDFDQGFRFVGLMSMIDPARADSPLAISKLREAGVKVIMVTGDHPITAKVLASRYGLLEAETAEDKAERLGINVEDVDASDCKGILIHGGELKEMSDFELSEILSKHSDIVFARTTGFQKLKIVGALQMAGDVVAVTGSCTTDVPALKTADLGIVLRHTASDVAMNAADMIVIRGFDSIFSAVDEAKEFFKRLNKFPFYNMISRE